MSWQPQQWEAFCALLDEGWPGTFDENAAQSWRVLLDGTDPQVAVEALRRLLLTGQRFRPSVAELLAQTRRDPGRPTFLEAYRLIFGARGVLAARPEQRLFSDAGERARAYERAALDRAGEMHPAVASFVAAQGVQRLREMQLEDPDWGRRRREELERAWNEHLERGDERHIASLASRRGELARLDPLAVLQPAAALPAGHSVPEEAA